MAKLSTIRLFYLDLPGFTNELKGVAVLEYDFDESIGYWLTMTTHLYHRALNEELAPHGVTYRQSQVLGWLALEGEMSQAQLAAKMMIEPATLVGILDRMERAGWISRRPCTNDRRRKWVFATPEAAPAWEKIVECAKRIRKQATDGLSEEELQALKDLLKRVQQNVGVRHPAAKSG